MRTGDQSAIRERLAAIRSEADRFRRLAEEAYVAGDFDKSDAMSDEAKACDARYKALRRELICY